MKRIGIIIVMAALVGAVFSVGRVSAGPLPEESRSNTNTTYIYGASADDCSGDNAFALTPAYQRLGYRYYCVRIRADAGTYPANPNGRIRAAQQNAAGAYDCPAPSDDNNQSYLRYLGAQGVISCYAVRASESSSNVYLNGIAEHISSDSNGNPIGDCPSSVSEAANAQNIQCIGRVDSDACEGASDASCGLTEKYINPLINFLSAGVAVVVTIMIIVGGIEYSTAGGDPAKITSAKKRILNAILAIVAFIFLWSFLQWIVPGGLL